MRTVLAAISAVWLAAPALAQAAPDAAIAQIVTIKASAKPTVDQSFKCAAAYAVALQAAWKETGKADPEIRASLRGWLGYIRSTTKKTNAELNNAIWPVVEATSAEISAEADPKAATIARRKACEPAEQRETAAQPAAATSSQQAN